MAKPCPEVKQVKADGPLVPETVGIAPQWFAVYTSSRHEKRVSERMAGRMIETFVPLYQAERQWKKSTKVVLELPLFPNYIFARITPSARGIVLSTPGVLTIVGAGSRPHSISDLEIETLRTGLDSTKAEPHPYLAEGDRVRIRAGLLSGLEGVLLRRKNECRVVITIETIMKSIAVEVDERDLEPAASLVHENLSYRETEMIA